MLPRPQLSPETLLRIQTFQNCIQQAGGLLGNDPSNESGIARMKLSEAVFWATEGLVKASTAFVPPQGEMAPVAPADGADAPIAPPANPAEPNA